MAKQTITALYDNRQDANNAALQLQRAGISDSEIVVSPEQAVNDYQATATPGSRGFWATLEEMFGGTDDHSTYAEGVRRGDVMLTVHVEDAQLDAAVTILEQHGSVDMNERETAWRGEGWTGAAITGGGVASTGAGPLRSVAPLDDVEERGVLAVPSTADAPALAMPRPAVVPSATAAAAIRTGADDVLQVVEERLNVGKRAVNRGKVRIHSYVVSTPVTETVTLRDETVTVDRRPVDRALAAGELGADTFRERSIEAEEIDEEAVVAKTVRVVEEIGIRKEVADRVETITDTVRSTRVDVEDDRVGAAKATALTGAVSEQVVKDMEVVGSDGGHVGHVDHLQGDAIKLKKLDPASGGQHHLVPLSAIATVAGKVTLKTSAAEVKRSWTAAG